MKADFDFDPQQWATLRSLLDRALELAPAERQPWFDTLGAEYDGLKPRLRALLVHVDATGTLPLDALPRVETADFAADGERPHDADAARAGERIGPYRLVRELGAGGMGSVWLAERTDVLQRRPVALKLPHGAWRRAGLAERLAREREIVATLNHPNIARLYDAGVAGDGQPYLAFEYVEGERLDAYSTRRALDVPARLRLFLQVARAVAHAHAKLVVHRDLKPGNILVTHAGEVRLLDFGIAKILEQGQAHETELTQVAGRALTPDYAAPEQILGQPIGTAADVYALGVVLFELLAGSRPYALKRGSRGALEEAILHAEPVRPSAATADARLRRTLAGDLDTIVLKALKKAPADRYATVDALAEDVERFLDHRPVRAQPDSGWYRLRKFLARNWLAVGGVSGVSVAIVAGALVAVWQARVARGEQRRAEEVLSFITSIFRDADPSVGPQDRPSAHELLARARVRVDEQFAARTATRIELLSVLAESLLGLQDSDGAHSAATAALEEATQLFGPEHSQALRARSVLAQVHRNRGQTQAMRAEIEHVIAALQRTPDRDRRRLVAAMIDRAEVELDEGRYPASEASAREALRLIEGSAGAWDAAQASAWKAISGALEARLLYQPATEAAEHALRHAQAARAGQPRHPQVFNARILYARLLGIGDRFREALPLMQQSVDDATFVYGADSQTVGQYLQNLAVTQVRAGDLAGALASAERALAILERHYGSMAGHVGAALDALAFVHFNARRPAAAIPLYERSLAIVVRQYGPQSEHVYPIRMRRAASMAYLGQLAPALQELRQVADEYARVGMASMTRPWLHLGIAERLAGRSATALELQQRALGAVREGPSAARERIVVQAELGITLVESRRFDEAIATLEPTVDTMDRTLLKPTPARSDAALALGRARLARGQPERALRLLEQVDAFWREVDGGSRWAGEAAFWLARCYDALGRSGDARLADARAAKILSRSPFGTDAALAKLARAG